MCLWCRQIVEPAGEKKRRKIPKKEEKKTA